MSLMSDVVFRSVAVMTPETFASPLTSSVAVGCVEPIPIFPSKETIAVSINPPVAIPVVTSEAVI